MDTETAPRRRSAWFRVLLFSAIAVFSFMTAYQIGRYRGDTRSTIADRALGIHRFHYRIYAPTPFSDVVVVLEDDGERRELVRGVSDVTLWPGDYPVVLTMESPGLHAAETLPPIRAALGVSGRSGYSVRGALPHPLSDISVRSSEWRYSGKAHRSGDELLVWRGAPSEDTDADAPERVLRFRLVIGDGN